MSKENNKTWSPICFICGEEMFETGEVRYTDPQHHIFKCSKGHKKYIQEEDLARTAHSSGQCRIESDDNILQLALNLHMYTRGSYPELSEANKIYEMLKQVLAHWQPFDTNFDRKVHELVKETIQEYEIIKIA